MWPSLAVPVAAVIIYLLIWYGPDVIASHDIGSVTGPLRVVRLQQARDAARGHLLTLGAGLLPQGPCSSQAGTMGCLAARSTSRSGSRVIQQPTAPQLARC